jgi:hypothetical protein
MAVNMVELLALPLDQRIKIAEALVESAVPPDFEALLREFTVGLRETNRLLQSTLERFAHVEDEVKRDRVDVREAVMRSGESWPFPPPDEQE